MIVNRRLDAVDAVPEQVGMMLLERAGPVGVAADDVADLGRSAAYAAMPGLNRSDELEKHGVPVSLGQLEDRDRVGQRAGDGLVDEDRLVRLEDGPRLLQVRPAVDAFEQDDVDLLSSSSIEPTIATPYFSRSSLV